MRRLSSWIAIGIAGAVVAACSPAGPTPQPSPPPGTPFLMRATIVQALPPGSTFGWLPGVLISVDGRVLTGGAVEAIYPGPLLQPIIEQRLPASGWALIVAAARDLGLLAGTTDFSGGAIPPGGMSGRLELFVDGRMVTLTGDPSRVPRCGAQRCVATPGTPETFAVFWNQVIALPSWPELGLGPESRYVPDGYAVVVGPAPVVDAQLVRQPVTWPGSTPLAAFGKPLVDGSGGRCGTVSGTDAVAAGAAFQAATAITPWHDAGATTLYGLSVRALLPGDGDPCEGLVGA